MSQLHFVGMSLDEARLFIESIVIACLKNCFPAPKVMENPLSIRDACKFLGVSKPTLRKYVEAAVVRRHDLGPGRKCFTGRNWKKILSACVPTAANPLYLNQKNNGYEREH